MAEKTEKPAEKIDFEKSIVELEKVVNQLDDEIKLEKALALFEQGMKLSQECEKFLKAAEQKVEVLKKSADGGISIEPFVETQESIN
jgi:exodeoxyribonuclease VII small subunit